MTYTPWRSSTALRWARRWVFVSTNTHTHARTQKRDHGARQARPQPPSVPRPHRQAHPSPLPAMRGRVPRGGGWDRPLRGMPAGRLSQGVVSQQPHATAAGSHGDNPAPRIGTHGKWHPPAGESSRARCRSIGRPRTSRLVGNEVNLMSRKFVRVYSAHCVHLYAVCAALCMRVHACVRVCDIVFPGTKPHPQV